MAGGQCSFSVHYPGGRGSTVSTSSLLIRWQREGGGARHASVLLTCNKNEATAKLWAGSREVGGARRGTKTCAQLPPQTGQTGQASGSGR